MSDEASKPDSIATIGDEYTDLVEEVDVMASIPPKTVAVFRAFVDANLDCAVVATSDGQLVCVNKKFLDTFGFTMFEAIGANVSAIIPAPIAARHDFYMQRYKKTGVARTLGTARIVRAKRKDGTTFPANVSIDRLFKLFSIWNDLLVL